MTDRTDITSDRFRGKKGDPFFIDDMIPLPLINVRGRQYMIHNSLYVRQESIALVMIDFARKPKPNVVVASFNPPTGSTECDEVCLAPMLDPDAIKAMEAAGILIGPPRYLEHKWRVLKIFKVGKDVVTNARLCRKRLDELAALI